MFDWHPRCLVEDVANFAAVLGALYHAVVAVATVGRTNRSRHFGCSLVKMQPREGGIRQGLDFVNQAAKLWFGCRRVRWDVSARVLCAADEGAWTKQPTPHGCAVSSVASAALIVLSAGVVSIVSR